MKRLMIALVLLPVGLCAEDREAFMKGLDKAVQQCNPGSQKKAEEWKADVFRRQAALDRKRDQQEQQRQRQLQQEKFNHGMNG